MLNILLIMQRKAIAEGLMHGLAESKDIRLFHEPEHGNVAKVIGSCDAKVALIEAAEIGPYNTAYCLALCKELRIQTPGCKLLFMCPEQDEQSVRKVVDAKSDNLIDDFVFYDVTTDYLASKPLSM